MKALHLVLNAFGPFKQKQTIDFSQLGEESIFLVTGPTGAGKTTIFDAMCFALYGRASGTDRDQDTLKSHFAADTDTTYVDFSFMLRGKQYRIERMPKQWKKKERGEGYKEEPTRAQLYIMSNGEERLIASKIKEVNDTVEELLSLDYDQFRKMIMIPQGEFRKLISENSKEREDILQKIFHTHFFSQLSEHFKDLTKSLEKQMEQYQWKLDQEIEKIHWLPDEESTGEEDPQIIRNRLEKTLNEQSIRKKSEEEELSKLSKSTEEAQENYHKAKSIEDLFAEQEKLRNEQAELSNQQSHYNHLSEMIELAKQANEVKPVEQQVEERNRDVVKLEQDFLEQKQFRTKVEEEYKQLLASYEKESSKEEEREQLKEDVKRKEEMREKLDQLFKLQKQLNDMENKQSNIQDRLNKISKSKKEKQLEKENLTDLSSKEREITSQVYDTKEKLDDAKRSLDQTTRLKKEWETLQQLRTKYQTLKEEATTFFERKEKAKAQYDEAVEQLKQHRAYHLAIDLTTEQACPVCGSTNHPSVAEKPDGVKSNEEMDRLKKSYEHYEQKYTSKHEEMTTARAQGTSQKQLVDTLLNDLTEQIEGELSTEMILEAFTRIEKWITKLQETWEMTNKQLNKIHEATDTLAKLEDNLNQLIEQEEELNKHHNQLLQEKVAIQTQLENLKNTYAFDTMDAQEMADKVAEAEKAYQQATEKWEQVQKGFKVKSDQFQQARTKEEELNRYLDQTKKILEEKKKEFKETLDQFNFSSEETYRKALMKSDDISQSIERLNTYNQRKGIIQERLSELSVKLKEETRPALNQMLAIWEEQKQQTYQKQEVVNEMNMVFKQNTTVLSSIDKLMNEQKEFAHQYYDLAELSNLARGDNPLKLSLERYVLASYLDEILVQANIRFDQMSDHRYQLLRSDGVAKRGAQSGLDLEVIDHHTGQKRSVRTLSGGEGFKASLSLALGMADVVQSHAGGVQLETLFIDEGFGTLDEVSLEQAIGCLRSLQDGNRMLGIISHVSQLKEEIPAKLQIHSGQEGSSVEFTFQ
ncbi:AAA family ATPase [Halobacillus seohaensis]|uniref:Nuclease SbcCD subunit C n=1 Tax=Halobacillus seohaensis TaxID=447421 RepID=A0ABW2EDV4_9BACI